MLVPLDKVRYSAEVGLHFRSDDRFLQRASDLPNLRNWKFQDLLDRVQVCHIYMIGKRPRVGVVPGTVNVSGDRLNLTVFYNLQGQEHRFPIFYPIHLFHADEISFEASAFPHREVISRDAEGKIVAKTLLANHVHLFESLPDTARDIEILYVGKGTAQSANDRLENHSTLQRILGDVSAADPENEIFVLLYSFEFKKPMQAIPGRRGFDRAKEETHLNAVKGYRPTLDDKVSLVEASCISYFQPPYNAQLLKFPDCHLAALDRARAADFACILVDLDNDPIGGARLFTSAVPAASYHSFLIDLREKSTTSLLNMLHAAK